MNTILVPTDFSENSMNATEYAAHMAKAIGAKIILLHVYDIPISGKKVASPIITLDEVEGNINRTCQLFKDRIHQNISPDIDLEYTIRKGDAVDEINKIAAEISVDMIVMGIIGRSKIDEILIGSVAAATMRTAPCPVLLIPGTAKFRQIEKIVFALDSKELSGSRGLSVFKEISNTFRAKILVLNVQNEDDPQGGNQSAGVNLPAIFVNDMNYSISFNEGENVVKGIHDFALQNNADIIAMIPRQHSLLKRLFSASKTKEVAYQTHIPLLALPEIRN